jgi:coenzyme A diphosphatase NUDT7
MSTKAAIARLRAYKPPPFSTWDHLPLSRRAAVLVLLFADRRGDLRVVLTMRAATLRNYSGMLLSSMLYRRILNNLRPSCIPWR